MRAEVIRKFKELVDAGIIRDALRAQCSMNWELPVADLGWWWNDVVAYKGWKIERHIFLGHYRIIGPDSIRYAFGSEEYISKRIMGISVNALTAAATRVRDSVMGRKSPSQENEAQVFAEFDRLVDSGRLLARLNDQASTNVEWGTWGGHVFWENLHEHRSWRIQQNTVFKNCRILGPDDTRYAWGIKSYLYRRILGQPVNTMVNYLHLPSDAENSFAFYPTDGETKQGSVVLVHGWGCRAIAMEWLARGLNRLGYDAYCYDYRSSSADIAALAQGLRQNLLELAAQKKLGKFHLLTHSMGGLLLRKALEDDATGELSGLIERVVMMGPPNQGSLLADLAEGTGVGIFNKSIGDMKYLTDSAVKHIGRPEHYRRKIGIIAGTFDLKVLPQESVNIPDMTEGTDYEIVRCGVCHPGLRTSYEALSQAVCFFQNGKFTE